MKKAAIAFIGGGNMGASLAGGLIADGYAKDHIWITDVSSERLSFLQNKLGVHTTTDNIEAVQSADIIIFCTKPQVLHQVASDLATTIQTKKPLVISIAAGIRETSLQQWLGGNIAIVRVMPNTPALIGCGASGLYANDFVSKEQHLAAETIMRAVGIIAWLEDENLMDAVTALSGSGPAYFFLIMDVLQQAGEKMGLTPEVSRLLTLQTALGAARMALESPETLTTLRKQVTSPGGTTEQGIRVLEEANIQRILSDTVAAAKIRSEELAKLFESTEL